MQECRRAGDSTGSNFNTMHANNFKKNMFDTSSCNIKITISDGNGLQVIMTGKKQLTFIQPEKKL